MEVSDPYEDDTWAGYMGGYGTAGNGYDESGGGCQWDDAGACSVYGFAINSGYIR